jgi:transcriptional regulator with XRE-family HTH domain
MIVGMEYKPGTRRIMVKQNERRLVFRSKLKKLREKRGLSQSKMALTIELETGIKVSAPLYEKWENKTRTVSADDAIAIADYFGINPKDLVMRK